MNTQLMVKKSNELVTARFSFSLMEMRLFTMIVSLIDDRDDDFKQYQIPVKDIISIYGITSKTVYAQVVTLSKSMLKKIITIPLKENEIDKEIQTTLFSSFKYAINGTWMLEISFNPILKPFLLQLKNRFLLYDIKNILKLSSWNSIRMYELLKSYEGIGKRVFGVEELKQILCVEEKYGKYANFKKKILLKSQEDLERYTDIRFRFEEISETSRRVDKLAFTIYKNKKVVIETHKEENPTQNWFPSTDNHQQSPNNRHGEIKAFGVSQNILENQILNEYEEDYIMQTLKYCKHYFKTTAVKQKSGFFLKALKEGYYKEEINEQSTKKVKKEQAKVQTETEEQEKQKLALEKEQKLKILREEFLTPEFMESVVEELRQNNTFMYKLVEKDYMEGTVNKYLQTALDIRLEKEFGRE